MAKMQRKDRIIPVGDNLRALVRYHGMSAKCELQRYQDAQWTTIKRRTVDAKELLQVQDEIDKYNRDWKTQVRRMRDHHHVDAEGTLYRLSKKLEQAKKRQEWLTQDFDKRLMDAIHDMRRMTS